MLTYLTCGGSHSQKIAGIISGLPSGLKVSKDFISQQLDRRKKAPGRGPRQKIERDDFEIISGLNSMSITDGSPIGIVMSNVSRNLKKDFIIRPSHADLSGAIKYNIQPWEVRERASARETAIRTALFCFTMRFVNELGVSIESRVISLAGARPPEEKALEAFFRKLHAQGISAGGIFELKASGVPIGLGSHIRAEERLSGLIFSSLGSLNAIKGIEIGDGFSFDRNGDGFDEILPQEGFWKYKTNRSGGINGGISNGEDIVIRCVVRPLSASSRKINSFNYKSKKKAESSSLTCDISALYPAAIMAEFILSYCLADSFLKKFGGDSMIEIKERLRDWRKYSCSKLKIR